MTEHSVMLKVGTGSCETGMHIFSVTAKAVRCYYELEKVVIFPHKIILSTAIMELSEFSNDSLLLIICHRVSRCSKSL